jgi:hypothetical protein
LVGEVKRFQEPDIDHIPAEFFIEEAEQYTPEKHELIYSILNEGILLHQ